MKSKGMTVAFIVLGVGVVVLAVAIVNSTDKVQQSVQQTGNLNALAGQISGVLDTLGVKSAS